MAAADPKLQALLELERRGALTPQASQALQAYRDQGATRTKPLGPNGKPAPANDGRLETAKSRDDARRAMDLIDRIRPHLSRTRELYDGNLKGSGPLQSLREYLPSQKNAQFDQAAGMLRLLVRGATRTPGEGAMSDFESKLALQPMPDRWSFDGSNEEALRSLEQFLDSNASNYAKRLGLPSAPPNVGRKAAQPKAIRLDANGNILK